MISISSFRELISKFNLHIVEKLNNIDKTFLINNNFLTNNMTTTKISQSY